MVEQRPLLPQERAVLEFVLSRDPTPGSKQLGEQLQSVLVVGGTRFLLDLDVTNRASPALLPDGPLTLRAIVESATGQPEGEIVVWVSSGYLSGLEYAWFTDAAPAEFPSVNRVRIQGPLAEGGSGAP